MSIRKRRARARGMLEMMNQPGKPHSLNPRVDFALMGAEKEVPAAVNLTEMSELDCMVAMGWGNTPQYRLPADWRERPGPDKRRRI